MYLVCSKLTLLRYLLSYWGFSQVFCSFYKVVQLWLFLLQLPQHILQIRNKKINRQCLEFKTWGKIQNTQESNFSNSFSELLKNVHTLTSLISVQLLITCRQENFPKLNKRVGSINRVGRKNFLNEINVQALLTMQVGKFSKMK